MNKVEIINAPNKSRSGPVEDFKSGTIVTYSDNFYVVAAGALRDKGFGAINLATGTYIGSHIIATVVTDTLQITPGEK